MISDELIILCEPGTNEDYNPLNFAVVQIKKEDIRKIGNGIMACKSHDLFSCKKTFSGDVVCGEIDNFTNKSYFEKELHPDKCTIEDEDGIEYFISEGVMLSIYSDGSFFICFSIKHSSQAFESPIFYLKEMKELFQNEETNIFRYNNEDEEFIVIPVEGS